MLRSPFLWLQGRTFYLANDRFSSEFPPHYLNCWETCPHQKGINIHRRKKTNKQKTKQPRQKSATLGNWAAFGEVPTQTQSLGRKELWGELSSQRGSPLLLMDFLCCVLSFLFPFFSSLRPLFLPSFIVFFLFLVCFEKGFLCAETSSLPSWSQTRRSTFCLLSAWVKGLHYFLKGMSLEYL